MNSASDRVSAVFGVALAAAVVAAPPGVGFHKGVRFNLKAIIP